MGTREAGKLSAFTHREPKNLEPPEHPVVPANSQDWYGGVGKESVCSLEAVEYILHV